MKAKIFCLSLALENPHQALDAYMSFRRRLRGYHAVSRRTTHTCSARLLTPDNFYYNIIRYYDFVVPGLDILQSQTDREALYESIDGHSGFRFV